MKRYSRHISLLAFLLFSIALMGQEKKDKFFRQSKKESSATILNEAKAIQEKSPAAAIKKMEEAIQLAKKERDWQTEGEAFVLLGNIYEDINQKDLALQRYELALKLLSRSKNRSPIAEIYQRIGAIHLDLENDQLAESNFRKCIEINENEEVKIKCEEGLADVELLRGNIDASFQQLAYVQDNFALDSMGNARVEARRSQGYLKKNDYSNASESYINSIQNVPKDQPVGKEDIAPIEKAKEDLLNFNSTTKDKINISQNSAQNLQRQTAFNDVVVAENLRIADLYLKDNNLSEANNFIDLSRISINEKTNVSISAEVYKKSYELNLKSGRSVEAYKDLEKYIELKEIVIDSLENDLEEQIAIVKGQKEIDQFLSQYNLEEKDRELMESQLTAQKIVIALLSLLLIASLVFFYFLFKNIKAKRLANQRLLLRSLRTQMNPHFIFNALNSVNNFIAKNDEKAANKFLADFSKLMRKVLDYSQKEFISFEEELELNELYLKLEHFRFRDKFDYELTNHLKNKEFDLMVPPMLIQPFIENAVWHGLRYKEKRGKLSVSIDEENKGIIVSVQDDGIGRTQSKALKTKNQKAYKSTGFENVNKRISLINEIYDKKYDIEISDVNHEEKETGTLVRIKIPFNP